jgi:hypothetical protein
MRRICLAILGAALFLVPLFGETGVPGDAAVIDGILSQKAISWGNASWLIGRAVETLGEGVSPADAAVKAAEAGWGPAGLSPDAPLDLKSYSLMLVKALSFPTGIMYRWFPGPRYALRELVFRKVAPATLAPDAKVSGAEAMRYLQAAQDWKEAHK